MSYTRIDAGNLDDWVIITLLKLGCVFQRYETMSKQRCANAVSGIVHEYTCTQTIQCTGYNEEY